jgi:biofilm PGA synthesis protein PgaA
MSLRYNPISSVFLQYVQLLKYSFLASLSTFVLIICLFFPGKTTATEIVEGDWAAALGVHLKELERNPADEKAIIEVRRAAMHLKIYQQAAALEAPISDIDRNALKSDQIALLIRYGRIDAQTLPGTQRYNQIDAALAITQDVEQSLYAGEKPDHEGHRRLMDRISALIIRHRSSDAIKLYEALVVSGLKVHPWATRDAAGAYLSQRRPDTAIVLYRSFLNAHPDDFEANLGLSYALAEAEHLDEALHHIDGYAERLPVRRHLDGQLNNERLSAEIRSDTLRIHADLLTEAQQRIEKRKVEMPHNGEVRAAEASLHLARGWKRQAELDMQRNLSYDPQNAGLRAEHANVLFSLGRWKQAKDELAYAEKLDTAHPLIQSARQTFASQERRELFVEAGYGQSETENPLGSSDWRIDSWLYSSRFADGWRIFAHNYSASADYSEGRVDWIRTGLGIEWLADDWRITGEMNTGNGEEAGVLLSLRWQPSDRWILRGWGESLTNNIPLQAVQDEITGRRAGLGVDWLINESRKFALESNFTEFSDENLRRSFIATWFERWHSGPAWKFETIAGADASDNSKGYETSYFNPSEDNSLWLTGIIEHLVWRHYDNVFRQRLSLSVGQYWQEQFDTLDTKAIEYQHLWELGPDVSLQYAIGRSIRPYDGDEETRTYMTMTLLWRF